MKHFLSYFKRNSYLMIAMITVFLSFVFALTILVVYNLRDLDHHTVVGTVYMSEVDESRFSSLMTGELNGFMTDGMYLMTYLDQDVKLPLDYFSFDMDQTFNQLVTNKTNLVVFELDDRALFNDLITSNYSSGLYGQIDMDLLIDDIINDLGKMIPYQTYDLNDYILDAYQNVVLNQITITSLDESVIDRILAMTQSIDIQSMDTFSILEQFGYTDLTNDELSVLAQGVLESVLKSEMTGFDFHVKSQTPIWSNMVFAVDILRVNAHDIRFYNGSNASYTIELEKTSSTSIAFVLYGTPNIYTYDIDDALLTTVSSEIIYQTNTNIGPTTPGVITTTTDTEVIYNVLVELGDAGAVHEYTRITSFNGEVIHSKVLFVIYLPQMPTIYDQHIETIGG